MAVGLGEDELERLPSHGLPDVREIASLDHLPAAVPHIPQGDDLSACRLHPLVATVDLQGGADAGEDGVRPVDALLLQPGEPRRHLAVHLF
jgi:hypothetical protein